MQHNKLKLSKRLELIASMVDKNARIIDVGCDHALLDIYLVKNGIIKKAIASDINVGALNQALKNVKLYNVKGVFVRLSDGLDALKKEDKINLITISGLGDKKIIDILEKNKNKLKDIKTIIVQSNTSPWKIRLYLSNLGYMIKDEAQVLEKGIIYTIIKFTLKEKKYSKKEIFFGPILLKKKDETFNKNLKNIIDKNNEILKKIPKKMFLKRIKLKIINHKIKKEMNL